MKKLSKREEIKHEFALGTVCYLSSQEALILGKIARANQSDWETISGLKDVRDCIRRSRDDFYRNCIVAH